MMLFKGRPVLNWRQAVPTAVTLAAMLAGFVSMLMTFEGIRTDHQNYYQYSALLIMLAMILDGLDGNLARWLKGTSEFGSELDTYVDMTAFGIAPAILIFAVTLGHQEPLWRVLLPSAVALSGVVRLARFKVKDPLRGQGGYAGLPITANAAWVALFVFISQAAPPPGVKEDFFSLQKGSFATLFLVGICTFITLQVTNLRYPKPTKKAAMFVPCVVLVILLWTLAIRGSQMAVQVAGVMIALGMVYVAIGPLFVKGMEAHKAKKARHVAQNGGPAADSGN